MAPPVIITARGLLDLHSCGQRAGLDGLARTLRNREGDDNASPALQRHAATPALTADDNLLRGAVSADN